MARLPLSQCLVYAERLSQCGRLDCRLFLTVLNFHPLSTGNNGFRTKSLLTKRLQLCMRTLSLLINNKNQTVKSIVYNYRTLRHVMMKKWRHFWKAVTLHFHFMDEYSKLYRVKMMGTTCGNIKIIWWNVKVNLQKLVGVCGYELRRILQNFMQKDFTEVKIFHKVLAGGTTFLNTL